ncbi:type III pantothenate kinase [Bordetella genomosp. 4]|uniref:Type III pantothenate kinase n=1 Tax=Bordetella genomosp. 4 TaxID=463044 RepID=A0A261TLG7_9BORD|nr:type III pantothenate kinase [Bordetella genomosp. 4]OZI41834.1 pantothenate kinase [Bordetella genomosp. 4]OZI50042.1 pantothenate kinase [Bordetella genomosp. 4]
MILLIDSGNSRLKVGWLRPSAGTGASDDVQCASTAGSTAPSGDESNLTGSTGAAGSREPAAIAFDNLDPHALGDWLGTLTHKPVSALGVNVAGDERGAGIRDALARHNCPVHWVTSGAHLLHLKNGYTQPTQLGADRLVSLLGVRSRLAAGHAPFVLASFGTATTIDTVGPDDTFIGGLILPGPALMRSSLARGTANLPLAEGSVTDFPTDTHQAIASGIAAAQAGAVVRQWLAACQRYGEPAALYVAGGGWPEMEHETQRLLAQAGSTMGPVPVPCYLDRPVLDGLALIASQTDPQSL